MNKWIAPILTATAIIFSFWVAITIFDLKGFSVYVVQFTAEQGARLEERTKNLEAYTIENSARLLRIESKLDQLMENKVDSIIEAKVNEILDAQVESVVLRKINEILYLTPQ